MAPKFDYLNIVAILKMKCLVKADKKGHYLSLNLFFQRKKSNTMTKSGVDEFISDIREAESPEDERLIIKSELADIRSQIKDSDTEYKPRLVMKLVYLSITGENTSWAQIESAGLMSHHRFSYKRIGYLAAQTFIDESNDMSVLLTQTILGDLKASNPFTQALALSYVANKGTAELCQEVSVEVNKLASSIHPGILKRVGMASVNIVRKVPELTRTFRKTLTTLLSSPKHGVVSSGIALAIAMIQNEPTFYHSWSHFSKPFTKLFKDMQFSKPTNEFRMSSYNDPFLQIKTMQLLGLLKQPSDELDDVLTSAITAIDSRRNTGRALLFQAVETIGQTAKKASLYSLALNQIGRLMNINQANVLYSALSVFSRLLYNGKEIISRSSRESIALKRYKSQVVNCLDNRDPSIRRRALDVVLALVDGQNVESLVPEVIDYLHLTADKDFRTEMVNKLFTTIQRFAPTNIWLFDTVHSLIIDSGNYIGNDIITYMCRLIATNEEVRNHSIPLLENTLFGFSGNQTLVKVASWAVGEYSQAGDKMQSDIDILMKIAKMPQTDTESLCYVLTAISKLAARLNKTDNVLTFLNDFAVSSDIELQQRSGELGRILSQPNIWATSLAPPDYKPLEKVEGSKSDANQGPKATIVQSASQNITDSAQSLIDVSDLVRLQDQRSGPLPQQQKQSLDTIIDDLLNLDPHASLTPVSSNLVSNLSNINQAPSNSNLTPASPNLSLNENPNANANPNVNPNANPNANTNSNANASITPTQSAADDVKELATEQFKPPPGAVKALSNADFEIYFEVQRNAANQNQVAIRTTIANLGLHPLTNFRIQYGVPVGWALRAQPLSSNVLPARGGGPLMQVLYLENTGSLPLMMKTHATFMFGSQPITADDVVNNAVFA